MTEPIREYSGNLGHLYALPEIPPTFSDVVRRVVIGTPLFAGGGALTAFIASKISSISISPIAGVIVGGLYGLISITTSVALKKLIGGNISHNTVLWYLKTVTDCALTALSAVHLCSAIGLTLTPLNAILLIPASIAGALGLTFASMLFDHVLGLVVVTIREIVIKIMEEINGLGKY